MITAAGVDLRVDMSNGGTAVFVKVMMLAVSTLASEDRDIRFAARIERMDQVVAGLGTVGFDLSEIDWGEYPDEHAAVRDFVLRATELARRRHRWDELGFDPPFAEGYLSDFDRLVRRFDPAVVRPLGRRRPSPPDAVIRSCVRHRILAMRPEFPECVFCTDEWR